MSENVMLNTNHREGWFRLTGKRSSFCFAVIYKALVKICCDLHFKLNKMKHVNIVLQVFCSQSSQVKGFSNIG